MKRNCLRKSDFGKTGNAARADSGFVHHGNQSTTMKKLFCILASAALFAACEQKTETVNTPAASPAEKKTENNTTVVNPVEKKIESNTTVVNPTKKIESNTTTTTSSPNPN